MNDKQKKVMELRDFLESIDGVNGIRIYGYIPLAEYLQEEGFRREKDTAREIYEILEKWVWKLKDEKGSLGNFRFAIATVMQEIKDKYSLEVSNFKLVQLKKGERNEKIQYCEQSNKSNYL